MKIKIDTKELNRLVASTAMCTLKYFENNGQGEIPYGKLFDYLIDTFWEMVKEDYNIKKVKAEWKKI